MVVSGPRGKRGLLYVYVNVNHSAKPHFVEWEFPAFSACKALPLLMAWVFEIAKK
jgi:hypothetical protein